MFPGCSAACRALCGFCRCTPQFLAALHLVGGSPRNGRAGKIRAQQRIVIIYIYIRYKQVCLLFMFSHCWSKRFFCEAKKYRTSITSASVQRTPNRGHGIRPSWASQCGAGAGESRVGEPREGPGIRPASVRRRLGVRDVAKEWYSKCTCTVCIYKTIYHIYIYILIIYICLYMN